MIERCKELAIEGHSRTDLFRNRLALSSGNPAVAFGDAKIILSIPQREIDNNPGLQGQQIADINIHKNYLLLNTNFH